MNFYESVGTFFQRGYLDPEMAWSGFSFYAIRWWSATKDYIFLRSAESKIMILPAAKNLKP